MEKRRCISIYMKMQVIAFCVKILKFLIHIYISNTVIITVLIDVKISVNEKRKEREYNIGYNICTKYITTTIINRYHI